METKVYIDGYNFYYGRLKGTPFKWLDFYELFERHLLVRNGKGNPILADGAINFFTAPIHERVAMDEHSVSDQHSYHTGLRKHLDKKIQIIPGYYDVSKSQARLVDGDIEPRHCKSVSIWKVEEKQSDVNVAVHAIYDVLTNPAIEQVVFVSNDTDILPALLKLREYREAQGRELTIGLVIPRREKRVANTSLVRASDWHIPNITDLELLNSQLPNRIVSGRKPSFKPNSWYESPQVVVEIMSLLKEAFGKMNDVYQWLDKVPEGYPNYLPTLINTPYQEMNKTEGAKRVLLHAKALHEYKINTQR